MIRLAAMRARATIIPLVLVLAGCGSSNTPSTSPGNSGSSGSSGGVALSARSIKGLGTVLVNAQGRTLYTFVPDKARKVTCTGACAVVWPPLKIGAGQKPSVSGGVRSSLVSSDPDPAGGRVVTYNGWPLYLYQADQIAGTDHGQDLKSSGGLWYAMMPSGTQITKQVKQPTVPSGGSYCLAANTEIETPHGSVQVDQIEPGMVVWSTDRRGRRIRVKVLRVHHARVPADHMMVRLRLADGRHVLVSLGHPLPSGQPVDTLVAGERFEGTRVASATRVLYGKPYTYDLLPAGPTHTYFADGVLLASTLAGTRHAGAQLGS